MSKTLALCPVCHYGYWREVGCQKCEPKVAEKKPEPKIITPSPTFLPTKKPKRKKLPLPSLETMLADAGDMPNALEFVRMVRAGYSPHYIKSVLGMGYAKKASALRNRYNIN